MSAVAAAYPSQLITIDRYVPTPGGNRIHAVVHDENGEVLYDHLFDSDGPVS